MLNFITRQLKFNYIPICQNEKVKANIHQALLEVQDEGNQAILHFIERIESDLIATNSLKGSGNKFLLWMRNHHLHEVKIECTEYYHFNDGEVLVVTNKS